MHNSNDITLVLDDEAATLACGARFANVLQAGLNIYLHGDLGAGKTTFARGVLQGLGHMGKVKSPTYALIESYHFAQFNVYHFDCYRFTDEEEWEAAGFREYFNPQSICIVEWAEKAEHLLPKPDIDVTLFLYNTVHDESIGRQIQLSANSVLGKQCLNSF